jgi:hypothetical protein
VDDARRPDDVTIERWEYDNPSWVVIAHHPVITTAVDGTVADEIEVQVLHRTTGERITGMGETLTMALAMAGHLISERA